MLSLYPALHPGSGKCKCQKSKRKKGSQEEELKQAASREPRSPQRSAPSRSWHTWSPIMMFYVLSPGHTKRHEFLSMFDVGC